MISVVLHDEQKIISLEKTYDGHLKVKGACEIDSFIDQLQFSVGQDTGWLSPNTLRQTTVNSYFITCNYWPVNKPVDCLMRNMGQSIRKLFIPNIIMINYFKDRALCGSYIAGTNQHNMLNIHPDTLVFPVGLPNTYPLNTDLGRICWGGAQPAIKADQHLQNFISGLMQAFVTSTFNSDLSVQLPTKQNATSLRTVSGQNTFFNAHDRMVEKNEYIVNESYGMKLQSWFGQVSGRRAS